MLNADTAAQIAAKRGLTLADASALRALTDDPEEADRLAAMFSEPDAEAIARRIANRNII